MQDIKYSNRIVVETVIPTDVGGFYIRELGIFDSDGELFAIANLPESYKPVQTEGATRDFHIRVVIEIENTENINLILDPSITIVTMDLLENHNQDVNAHYRKIDADKVDGYHAGNEQNQVGVSNGIICQNLNADLLDGHHAGNSANEVLVLDENGIVPEENLNPYAPANHTHELQNIINGGNLHSTDNMFIHSGINSGTTSFVDPPEGYTMANLMAFICSIRTIYFNGVVDNNDSLYCYWQAEEARVRITCYNSEQRATPTVNWLAIWRK
jgi:hypothetical protein